MLKNGKEYDYVIKSEGFMDKIEFYKAMKKETEAPNDRTAICEWREDAYISGDPYYNTNCGDAFSLVDGSLKDNNYNYCPGCGGKIKLSRTGL